VTSGIRVGTPAMTTRGFGEDEFVRVVELIDEVLSDPDNEAIHERVRREVNALCERFPLYDFVVA
jgi:glycine hydroxymethyltransferase